MQKNLPAELREALYGEPEKAVPWMAVALGLGIGLATRSLGMGLLATCAAGKAWDFASPRLVIDDPRLGALTLRAPRRDQIGRKQIWLTFDDGPSSQTDAVLDLLEDFGASATFFFIASQVPKGDTLVALRSRLESGAHRVGNHSWSHPNFLRLKPQDVRREVECSDAALREAFGELLLPAFRPPYGYRSSALVAELRRANLKMMGWSVNSLDFLVGAPERVVERVLWLTDPGSVVLFHDGPKDRTRTLRALTPILERLSGRGFVFATPTEKDLV